MSSERKKGEDYYKCSGLSKWKEEGATNEYGEE